VSEPKVHVLSGSRLEIRSQLLDRIEETGAVVFRKQCGRFEVAIVLPHENEPVTDEEGTALCKALDELQQVLAGMVVVSGSATRGEMS
jgi:hypothetical protein